MSFQAKSFAIQSKIADSQPLLKGTNIRKYCYSILLCVKSCTTRKTQTFVGATATFTPHHHRSSLNTTNPNWTFTRLLTLWLICFDKEHMYHVTGNVGNRVNVIVIINIIYSNSINPS